MTEYYSGIQALDGQSGIGTFAMHTTPASLLLQVRQPGNQAAWDRFVRLYTPFLYRCIRPLGLQESDRADLLQEVFLVLYRELPKFSYDGAKSFRAWLRTVLLNKWRDLQRRRSLLPMDACNPALVERSGPDHVADFAEDEYRQYLVNRALQLMQSDFQPTTWQACWEHIVRGRPASDEGLKYLACPSLQTLGLEFTAVTDAGLDQLKRFRGLRNLGLVGTRVSAQGVSAMHAALPQCRIQSDARSETMRSNIISNRAQPRRTRTALLPTRADQRPQPARVLTWLPRS